MKVLYILGQNSGGLPHYAAGLANAVAEHAEVIVLKPTITTADSMFSDEIILGELFSPMDISTQSIYDLNIDIRSFMRGFLSYRNLKAIRDYDPDVVHNLARMFPQVQLFARIYNISKEYPFVETWHEVPELSFGDPLFLLIELLNRTISIPNKDKIIVHTNSQKERLKNRTSHPDRIEVIPHGAVEFFKENKETPQKTSGNQLLFFGHIIPQKGLDTLVKAIPLVRDQISDISLIIAGSGKISPESKNIIHNYPDNFEIYNQFIPNEEVGDFFNRADVVVLPYDARWKDGHSGPLTIAFSFGKPIIATNVGDFPDMVGRSGSGLVVPSDNPEQLATAIVQLLNNKDMRLTMQKNSSRMRSELSWEKIGKKHMHTYEELSDSINL